MSRVSLWTWALEAYARPGVPQACLTLQDEYGQNTSLLLWAAWSGAAEPERLAAAADAARRWDEAVLHPIRAVRRRLKDEGLPVSVGREDLRNDVKAIELKAERLLMETLERLEVEGGAQTLAAMAAAARAWGQAPPDKALADLADALGSRP